MPKLLVLGPDSRPAYEIPIEGDVTLNRNSVNPSDFGIARQSHCRIYPGESSYEIQDLDSRNGTLLNGLPLTRSRQLGEGDEIVLGATRLIYSDGTEESKDVGADHGTQIFARVAMANFVPSDTDAPNETQTNISAPAETAELERLRVAIDIMQAVGAETDTANLLEIVLDRAAELFRADHAALLQPDENGKWRCTIARGHGDIQAVDVNFSRTLVGSVAETRQGLLFADAQTHEMAGRAASIQDIGIRSAMAVPLQRGNEVLGVLQLDTVSTTNVFQQIDLNLLACFAGYAARALDRARLARHLQEEKLVRAQLGRLLSPNLVDEVVAGNLEVKLGGEKREVIVLFGDIRGFTAMSGSLGPEKTVSLLNEFFEAMVGAVFEFDGTLDKMVGDEVMAIWGAPVARDDDVARALAAALKMQVEAARLDREWIARGDPALGMGIGLALGEAVVGYIGSTATLSYTVIGTTVNLAARLCSAAGPREILIPKVLKERAGIPAEAGGTVELKGFTDPVHIFKIKPER